ncbi:MAG TPA: hypothetical protein VEO94_02910 [Candidatus Dormibacteraeota bacterium]|nr:hypothetical protein [Candidatus Dormibacteraeota bacterium]
MRNRTGKACLAVAGFLTLFGGVSPPAIAQERPLEGQVIGPTDTELRTDYRRIMEETESDVAGGAGSVAYRRLDLAVFQDLPWVAAASARWRVLMAYQGLLYASLEGPAVPGSGVTSRVTGGVDVSF